MEKRFIFLVVFIVFVGALVFWFFAKIGNPFVSYPECSSEDIVVAIPDMIGISVDSSVDDRIHPDLLSKLEYAGKLAQDFKGGSYELVINSAFRSYKEQAEMYDRYKEGKGNAVLPPDGCVSSHMQGYAIDICMFDKNNPNITLCNFTNQDSNGSHPLMQTMQEIMQNAGFSRYCYEWWHFEGYPMSESCPPGIYSSF